MYEFSLIFIGLFAGIAVGCMIMAVLQRRAPQLRARLGLGHPVGFAPPAKRPPQKVAIARKREARR